MCCIVSAELPEGQAPLPEGCDWQALEAATNEEIRTMAQEAVNEVWRTEEPYLRQYISSGIADMASGQRVDAEHAIAALQQEWQDGAGEQEQWRPMWRMDNPFVEQARATMQSLGIDAGWVRQRLTEGVAGQHNDDTRLAHGLWEHGLWRNSGENTSLWQGLTMVARACLQTPHGPDWLLQPSLPDATTRVLLHSLRVERQIKHHLLRLIQSAHFQVAVNRVLDEPTRNGGRTQREHILEEIERIPDFWERRFPYVPPEHRCNADVLVNVCSFGTLSRIVYQLLPRERYSSWRRNMKNVVDARNMAAHGGWFSLAEYGTVVQSATMVEAELTSLRFGYP